VSIIIVVLKAAHSIEITDLKSKRFGKGTHMLNRIAITCFSSFQSLHQITMGKISSHC
jgi:hypothetical protein